MAVNANSFVASVADAKSFLAIPTADTAWDTWLEVVVNAAAAWLDSHTGRKLAVRAYATSPKMYVDGTGKALLYAREFPVVSFTAAYSLDAAGAETLLDTTGIRGVTVPNAGGLYLPGNTWPEGVQNIRLVLSAGYDASLTPDDYSLLKWGQLRIIQVMFQDQKNQMGRGVVQTLGNQSISMTPDEMPKDIQDLIKSYRRRA
jgi:hypothetical protein